MSCTPYNGVIDSMLNSRSIRAELWEEAREALEFYFRRRHGAKDSEDLAHETLQAILIREDYLFEEEDQFLRVCYGFAKRISKKGRRDATLHEATARDAAAFGADEKVNGMSGVEARIFLDDIRRTAEAVLTPRDLKIVELLMEGERPGLGGRFRNSNQLRVHVHRIRRKLAQITGWPVRRAKV